MSREQVLSRIRRSLGSVRSGDLSRRAAAQERLAKPFRHLIPSRARRPRPELLRQFVEELGRQSADVVEVSSRDQIPAAVAFYLKTHGLPLRLRFGEIALLASLPWAGAAGLEAERGPARADDRVGVSHALAGVAETGTLVLASGQDNPVSLAFLPETHIVTVAERSIAGAFEDAFEFVRLAYGRNAMPRSLNFISGPSRTGDIGGRIVLGAHGPRRLAVIVIKAGDAVA